jgi:sterol 3beta-glucosyltransferase
VTILSGGSRGDVDPYRALGVALQSCGHSVRLATFEPYATDVMDCGLQFWPVTSPAAQLATTPVWQAWQASTGGTLRHIRHWLRVAHAASPAIEQMLHDYWAACQDADAIISGAAALTGPDIADQLSLPHVWALLQPMSPTRAFPHFLSPLPRLPAGLGNRLTYRVAERVTWWLFRKPVNRWRTGHVGLAPLTGPGPLGFPSRASSPVLYGFSPLVIPKPADWDGHTHVTGYWFIEPLPDWQPAPDLLRFLAAGPPPVGVSLGRLRAWPLQRLLDLILSALRALHLRAILIGPPATSLTCASDGIFMLADAPFSWLFRQLSCVVHHGGHGTTGTALHAGIPSVTITDFFDRPFWGRRLAELGVAPPPIRPDQVSIERIQSSLNTVTHDAAMRAQAARFGARIQAENGRASALQYLDEYL